MTCTSHRFSFWLWVAWLPPWLPVHHFSDSPRNSSVSENLIHNKKKTSIKWVQKACQTNRQVFNWNKRTRRTEHSISLSPISFRTLSRSFFCLSIVSFRVSTDFCLSLHSFSGMYNTCKHTNMNRWMDVPINNLRKLFPSYLLQTTLLSCDQAHSENGTIKQDNFVNIRC